MMRMVAGMKTGKNLTSSVVVATATMLMLLASLVAPTAIVAQTTVSLTVASAYADGATPPPSMWSTIRQDDTLVASGFTPLTADVSPGVEYAIYLADYQDITLHHWEDTGEFSRPRPVTMSADTTFTGLYVSDAHPLPPDEEEPDPEPEPEPSGTSTLTVNTQFADGAEQNGMWTVLYSDGSTVDTGFSPVDFTLDSGEPYVVSVGDYNDVNFHHWDDDSTTRQRPITITNDTAVIAYYVSDAHPLPPDEEEPDPEPEPEPDPDPDFTTVTHMSDTTQSYGILVSGTAYSGNHQIAAELARSNSVLVGKQIDEVTMMLQRVGTPTGNAQVAVFDANQNVKQLFADVDVTTIPTSMTEMTFSISGLYTIEADDRIGLRFTGGSSSSGVSVMMDKVTSDDVFDGQNSQRARGTSNGGWITYDINEDLYMILRQTKDNLPPIVQPVLASVQENDIEGVAITLQGSDPDGDALTYYPVTPPTKGTLSLVDGNVIHYTPYDWQDGTDSFQYVANDGTNDSLPATASINIEDTGSKTTSKIVVISEYEDGISNTGFTTTLSQGGTTINSGFTHVDFQVNNGENYAVTVSSGGGTFVRWDDTSSTNTSRTINISQDTAITAVYRRS